MADAPKSYAEFWMAQTPLLPGRTGVVEVIRDVDDESQRSYVVLVSELVDERLQCRIAFTADPLRCDTMNARGLTCIEALIDLKGDVLTVRAAAFVPKQREMDYEHAWMTLHGVVFGSNRKGGGLPRDYLQVLTTPDLVLPGENVRMVPTLWRLDRQHVAPSETPGDTKVTVAALRWPETFPLNGVEATHVWTGTIARFDGSEIWNRAERFAPRREKRPVEFRSPKSSFRSVEVLGIRLDVPRFDARRRFRNEVDKQTEQERQFYELISPLNFHLPSAGEPEPPHGARPDFYYRPATSGLTIELLRYGQMSVAEPIGGLDPGDIQSQHELLVRVVVGRVDEDAGQAQEVSTFVPALFVDNTWSKHLGRQYMGLDKKLAYFCLKDGDEVVPLSPRDACDLREAAPALARIADIRLADRVLPERPADRTSVEAIAIEAERKRLAGDAPVLLTIECDQDVIDGWDDFRSVPTDAVLRNSPLAGRRWRQEDFDDPEVRRDFARAAGQGSAGSFLGTQVTPLINEEELRTRREGRFAPLSKDEQKERWATQAWVSGRYSMTGNAMMARPRGKITVKLHRGAGDTVEAWRRLCNLFEVPKRARPRDANENLPDATLTFTLGPGSWYRLKYDMDLAMLNLG